MFMSDSPSRCACLVTSESIESTSDGSEGFCDPALVFDCPLFAEPRQSSTKSYGRGKVTRNVSGVGPNLQDLGRSYSFPESGSQGMEQIKGYTT